MFNFLPDAKPIRKIPKYTRIALLKDPRLSNFQNLSTKGEYSVLVNEENKLYAVADILVVRHQKFGDMLYLNSIDSEETRLDELAKIFGGKDEEPTKVKALYFPQLRNLTATQKSDLKQFMRDKHFEQKHFNLVLLPANFKTEFEAAHQAILSVGVYGKYYSQAAANQLLAPLFQGTHNFKLNSAEGCIRSNVFDQRIHQDEEPETLTYPMAGAGTIFGDDKIITQLLAEGALEPKGDKFEILNKERVMALMHQAPQECALIFDSKLKHAAPPRIFLETRETLLVDTKYW